MQNKFHFRLLAIVLLALTGFIMLSSFQLSRPAVNLKGKGPRIVNIVNFIRLLEPRDSAITEDVLYQTVEKQVALMKNIICGAHFSCNMMPCSIPGIKSF